MNESIDKEKIMDSALYGNFKSPFELKTFNMYVEELEQKYGIKITFNMYYFKIYNIFGKLWFTASSLKEIENEMKNIYKEK